MHGPIPSNILARRVEGLNLRGASFADQLEPGRKHVLAFLRHFG